MKITAKLSSPSDSSFALPLLSVPLTSSVLAQTSNEACLARFEAIAREASFWQGFMQGVEIGRSTAADFTQTLHDKHVPPSQATILLDQLDQILRQNNTSSTTQSQKRRTTKESSDIDIPYESRRILIDRDDDQQSQLTQKQALDVLERALLRGPIVPTELAKYVHSQNAPPPSLFDSVRQNLLNKVSSPPGPDSLPKDAARHIKDGCNTIDPIVAQTYRLRQAYSCESCIDPFVEAMRPDLIPEHIWKNIVLDQYVNFEDLHTDIQQCFEQYEHPEDLASHSLSVGENRARPVLTKDDWLKTFRTWKEGVIILYPHREDELNSYERIVAKLFQANPTKPQTGIHFDAEARRRYAKVAYRLDDRASLPLPSPCHSIHLPPGAPAPPSPRKHAGPLPSPPPAKRRARVCQNWNFGVCSDPCSLKRRHGICCECKGNHAACDSVICNEQLREKKRRPVKSKRT